MHQVSTDALHARVEDLRTAAASQQAAIVGLERKLDRLGRQRDAARDQVAALAQDRSTLRDRLASIRAERAFLGDRLDATESRVTLISDQHAGRSQVEQGLRWQVTRLKSRLEALAEERESARMWVKSWVANSVEALQQLFAGTGIDLDTLMARAAGTDGGLGGPFESFEPAIPEQPHASGANAAIVEQLERLSALQTLANSLPLAAPLDHFHITSQFGKRHDPFNRTLALHAGLDFGAARGSEILATAPGRVLHAGPAGPYGNLIEIDHGMGVVTRFGHLKTVLVNEGEEVRFRQPIGVIGSTGRSTGRHLHYEIRIDDVPHDPARFLEAGRYLVDVFQLRRDAAGGDAGAG